MSNPYKGGRTAYPAYKKECCGCRKIGHFNSVCRSTGKQEKSPAPKEAPIKVKILIENYDSEDEYIISDLTYGASTIVELNAHSSK